MDDKMNRKEKIILFILAVFILGAVVYSTDCLLLKGVLSWQFHQKAYLSMLSELILLFGLLVLNGRLPWSAKTKTCTTLFFLAVFLWAHQMFLPVITSGLYAAWLWLCGFWLRRRIFSPKNLSAFSHESQGKAFCRDFFAGCLFAVCVFCLMSAAGIGQIEYLWIFVAVSAALILLALCFWEKKNIYSFFPTFNPQNKGASPSLTLGGSLIAAAILTTLCIQAGRMNIAVDFDSLWYGVRSPYILNNGGGIYENLGTIGVVYTYSKGLEVLILPLSILPSYSFAISFHLWLAAGVLMISWQIGKIYLDRKSARLMLLFLASLPGIMNMTVSAKSDMATLYIQLFMLFELLGFLQGERPALWYAFGAFFFSWTLKPTAMVFSTAIMGMSILYFLFTNKHPLRAYPGQTRKGSPEPPGSVSGAFAVFILSLAALTGIWARTFLITGLPVTSVFSSVLTRIGFQMKYPFNAKTIPNNTAETSFQDQFLTIVRRICGVLFNPKGKDLDHVIIAWGSLSTWFILCFWPLWLFLDKKKRTKKEKRLDTYLNTIFLPFSACCFASLILLYQVDGNYFMLFYVLCVLYIFRLAKRLNSQKAAGMIRALTVPVAVFSLIITTLTSWAWSLGFTPVSWKHKGYYPHQEIQHQEMIVSGNGQIWEILSQNPRNRLISIGDHPQSLVFPCNAQSYRDITKNAWGNPELAETAENFTEFMAYAKTDYLYLQADYITRESHEWQLIRDLINKGILVPLCCEQGNVLFYVDTAGTPDEDCGKFLEKFMEEYTFFDSP